jgi:hypothetical protein
LIHVGSGGAVANFVGTVSTVMPVAHEIAECGDWTLFDMPGGWKQTDPDLMNKRDAIIEAHPEARGFADIPGSLPAEAARAVIEAGESAT